MPLLPLIRGILAIFFIGRRQSDYKNLNALCVLFKMYLGTLCIRFCWAGATGFRAGNLFCHLPYRQVGEKVCVGPWLWVIMAIPFLHRPILHARYAPKLPINGNPPSTHRAGR